MKVNLMSTKSRNYFLDNYKALLILLVVIGHLIEPCYTNNIFLSLLKWVIFSFHMPAFIFISGYFSKKNMSPEKLIQKLVIPYFVFELLYYVLYVFVIHKETGLYFNRPKFSLWYLMSLFFWRVITPYFKKIPGNLCISIVLGLLIGFTQLGNFFSIPRTLFFYPFFLAGFYFQENWFKIVWAHWKGFTAGLAALSALLGSWVLLTGKKLSPLIFYGRYSYTDTDLTNIQGLFVRLICYGISFFAIFTICSVIPRQQHFYSILGVRTMSIYLFHGLIYSLLKDGGILEQIDTSIETGLLLGFSILLTFTLATNPPYHFVTWISSFSIQLPKGPCKPKKLRYKA